MDSYVLDKISVLDSDAVNERPHIRQRGESKSHVRIPDWCRFQVHSFTSEGDCQGWSAIPEILFVLRRRQERTASSLPTNLVGNWALNCIIRLTRLFFFGDNDSFIAEYHKFDDHESHFEW
jgi:hypothetical protein